MTFDISEINFIVYNELVKWMRHMNKLFKTRIDLFLKTDHNIIIKTKHTHTHSPEAAATKVKWTIIFL